MKFSNPHPIIGRSLNASRAMFHIVKRARPDSRVILEYLDKAALFSIKETSLKTLRRTGIRTKITIMDERMIFFFAPSTEKADSKNINPVPTRMPKKAPRAEVRKKAPSSNKSTAPRNHLA